LKIEKENQNNFFQSKMITNRSACLGRFILRTHLNLAATAARPVQTPYQFHTRRVHGSSGILSLAKSDAPKKSALSSELNDILSKKEAISEGGSSSERTGEGPGEDEEKPKGRLANAFSREHGWKVTLALFGGIFTGGALYTLFAWGAPRMDENNKPVCSNLTRLIYFSLCCYFFLVLRLKMSSLSVS